MNLIGRQPEGDWFFEIGPELWPGRALALEVKEILHEQQSEFQRIRVFDSVGAGRVLTLDGVIQLTESDEFAYQEMMTHVPLFAHPEPRDVLVVGGGDGGVVREAARHACVRRIDLCEIDRAVVEVSRRFFPFMASALDDPRVTVHYEDGAKFAAERPGQYDAIVVDSSDPIGPAEVLFREPFYRSLHAALRDGGVAVTQAESMWLHRDLIRGLIDMARGVFPTCAYGYTCVPTYPSGQIGFLFGSKGPAPTPPARRPDPETQAALRYYTPGIHESAFELPAFARRALG